MNSFAELTPALQRLLELEKMEALAEFAAGAGHEMNNPLAVICGRAQLLLRTEVDPERRRELAIIHTQALRVNEMIADLMLFARPPQPQLAEVDVAQLCRTLRDEVAPEAQRRNIELTSEIPAPLPLTADPVQLAVAVRALLDNALEALVQGGHVTLACRFQSDTDEALIVVSDDGPGFTPEVRRHLFDPYFSGRPAGRGLGLGLSKAWRIITNHGGRIEVDSEPSRGAAFRIVLTRGRESSQSS